MHACRRRISLLGQFARFALLCCRDAAPGRLPRARSGEAGRLRVCGGRYRSDFHLRLRLVVLAISMLVLCPCGAAGADPPAITGFAPLSALPFALITIQGTGFDANAQLLVTFSDSGGYVVSEAPVSVTGNAIRVSLPPFINQDGSLGEGTVSIQVSQTPPSGPTFSSNTASGLRIEAPPSSMLPSGDYVLAILQAALSADIDLQTTLAGTSADTPDVQDALAGQIGALQELVSNVAAVADGTRTSFVIGTQNGSDISGDRTALAAADRLVLSLLAQLAAPSPGTAAAFASPVPGSAATSPNPVQLAAEAALNAHLLSDLNAAAGQLAVALAGYAGAHPRQTTYALLLGGATIASFALGPEVVAFTGGARGLALAGLMQAIAGIEELNAPVELLSFKALSVAAPQLAKVGCRSLNGTRAGVVESLTGFAEDTTSKLVLGGRILERSLMLQDAVELIDCASSLLSAPSPGFYAEMCTAATEPITCCAGESCTTQDGFSAASPTETVPVPRPSQLKSELCPQLTAAFTGAGCASTSCAVQYRVTDAFTLLASCTVPPVTGCSPGVLHVVCGFTRQ